MVAQEVLGLANTMMNLARLQHTKHYRLRAIKRDTEKIAVALENLRIGILKVADRAHSAGAHNVEDSLREAGRMMGLTFASLDGACGWAVYSLNNITKGGGKS